MMKNTEGNPSVKKTISAFLALLTLLPLLLMTFSSCKAGGDAVMEYNGYKITEGMYRYWLATFKSNILSSCGVADSEEFWKIEVQEGVTAAEYYTDIIDTQVKNYCVAQYLFRYYGLKLDEEIKKGIRDDVNEKIDYYGGRAELNEELAYLNINIDTLEEIYTIEEKHAAVVAYLYGVGGPLELSAEAVRKYYEENYSRMMYIVLFTTKPVLDESGNYVYSSDGVWKTENMTEEELAAVRAEAEELTARAKEGNDETFVSLMDRSDYQFLSSYPNGLFVSANEFDVYGAKMVTALDGMKPGDVTSFEEDESIWIVRKLPLTDFGSLGEADIGQLAALEQYAITADYADTFSDWNAEVKTNDELLSAIDIVTAARKTDSNF